MVVERKLGNCRPWSVNVIIQAVNLHVGRQSGKRP